MFSAAWFVLRLVIDTDVFLFLVVRLVGDAFLFLAVRLAGRRLLLDRILDRPFPVWAYLCARCTAFILATLAPSRARTLAASLTFLTARTSPSKLTPLVY